MFQWPRDIIRLLWVGTWDAKYSAMPRIILTRNSSTQNCHSLLFEKHQEKLTTYSYFITMNYIIWMKVSLYSSCLLWELALCPVICDSLPFLLFSSELKTTSLGDNYSVSFIVSNIRTIYVPAVELLVLPWSETSWKSYVPCCQGPCPGAFSGIIPMVQCLLLSWF